MDGTLMAMTVLATYDVREDARRAHLAAVLQAFGNRIQKSVFLLQIDADELSQVITRAEAIIDPEVDSLWLLRQCAPCYEALITMGQTEPPQRVLYWAAF